MKKLSVLAVAILILGTGIFFGWGSIVEVGAQIKEYFSSENDADLPPKMRMEEASEKEDFLIQRAEGIALKRGLGPDSVVDPQARPQAIAEMDRQEKLARSMRRRGQKESVLAAWTPIGPAPIPNGNGNGVAAPTSGRTIAIAVHPTNPDIVYAGAAQGGLYRSTDGGVNWTPLMDNALSLAIGAIAIAPSQPDTIYVGTGEANFSADSFFGVGVYRIDNASTVAPIITGPLNKDAGNADIFTGRSIGKILVHPTDPNTIFVASSSGGGGIGGGTPGLVVPSRGIYRSTNATSANPTFAKLTGLQAAGDFSIRDMTLDPLNANLLVCNLIANGGGIYVSTDALAASPTFVRRVTFSSTSTSELTAEFAVQHTVGQPNPTIYAATGNLGGRVLINTDGGTTWTQQIDNNFCTPQCFYDIAVDVDPTNPARVYLAGAPAVPFAISTTSGTAFTNSSLGLHVDSHAIAVAPSLPSTIYFGSDGGIWKSTDSGANWTPLNNSQYSATQFMSLAVHPTDRYFTIGGTQDNGTNFYQPSALWTNTEGGDGGYTQIDQNAQNNTAVTMYHTFFNQTNAMEYSRSLNAGNSWQGFGCGFSGVTANGMTCAATAILFYAPLERGPGNPNTLYFGSDVLYRSSNSGTTVTKVSQEPIQNGVAISAIGISPQDDNVRIVGQSNGNLFGTTTGSSVLTNLDAGGVVPSNFIARAVIAPNSTTTAYVTLSAFGVPNVWKTTDLNAVNPTWTAANSGLPLVPVSAFVIDPQDPNALYAGTDIGVYQSLDGGTSWLPYGTGLPRVAVFDADISNVHRILRIATHGRGMYETPIPGTLLPVVRAAGNGTSGPGGASAILTENCPAPGGNGAIDPGETVTVSYTVQNVGAGPTTNLTATLQPTGGVTNIQGTNPQSYGAVPAGTSASRNFTFTANAAAACGSTITLTFQLQDGATNYGNVTVDYVLGAVVNGAPALTESFDSAAAPALPAGWTTAQTGTAPAWVTSTTVADTAPNAAFGGGTATPGDNSLTSPTIAVPAAPVSGTNPGVEISFATSYLTEGGFDGGVMEISINAGPFTDVVTAGGSFTAGGYNGTIGVTDSVLTGRAAWTGNSNGFVQTALRLPPASYGQNAQFRWRTAYDTGTHPTGGGLTIDTVSLKTVTRVCCTAPLAADVSVSGRVLTPDGRGLTNARVTLTGPSGETWSAVTGRRGIFTFGSVPSGETYILAVAARRFQYEPRVLTLNDSVSGIDLYPEGAAKPEARRLTK